ncbi:hypothetical protein BH24ACT4_BH24ACT4_16320 [soil metagenome]
MSRGDEQTTDPSSPSARGSRGLTRSQYLGGSAVLVLAGMTLVSALAVVFAQEGGSAKGPTPRTFSFEAGDADLDVVGGAIVVDGGRAVATEASADEPAVALLPDGVEEGRLSVVAVEPAPGWGLVFRWQSADDHWFVVVPAPDAPLQLGVAEGGRSEVLDATSQPVTPGAEVDVRFDANRVDVRVDGQVVATARGRAGDGRRLGLWADAPGPVWADLALGPRPTPVIREDG